MTDRYAAFDRLLIDRPAEHVLRLTINAPEKMNALDGKGHHQLETIWAAIDDDPDIRVSIVTGAGRAFCAGGDMQSMPVGVKADPNQVFAKSFRGATELVNAIINSRKPIVSAINGPAVGAGLAIALLADIPIAAKTAKLIDGHLRLGVAPGDHSALIWPLLCGMAKSKYFLMTNETLTGEQAENMNLVALSVEADELAERAVEVASKLAGTAPTALQMTKYVFNHWLRRNQAIFDLSAAFEMANFAGEEAERAMAAMADKTAPKFDGGGF